jgi:hypothetical protein
LVDTQHKLLDYRPSTFRLLTIFHFSFFILHSISYARRSL